MQEMSPLQWLAGIICGVCGAVAAYFGFSGLTTAPDGPGVFVSIIVGAAGLVMVGAPLAAVLLPPRRKAASITGRVTLGLASIVAMVIGIYLIVSMVLTFGGPPEPGAGQTAPMGASDFVLLGFIALIALISLLMGIALIPAIVGKEFPFRRRAQPLR